MILNKKAVDRLGIFFFYDSDGVVDSYVTYLLEELKKELTDLLVVCNGKLNAIGRETLLTLTDNVIVRENTGFDVWAYKEGIEYIGWDKIKEYDEVVLLNSTIFGPLYSFNEMFENMAERNLDFWGITKHHKVHFDPFGTIKYGYIPEHIQSHFIVIRNKMLNSYEFKHYWDNMRMINSYSEAIGFHEAIFTKDFYDKGFNWDVYVNTDDLEKHTYYPLQMVPLDLVKNRKCPIIKRRNFFHEHADFLNNTTGEQSVEVYEYIKENLDYDVNLMWENILRTCNQADIKRALNLNYVLSTTTSVPVDKVKNRKIALILHIYFEDLIQYCFDYASAMPPESDIYVTTDSKEKAKLIATKFKELKCSKLDVRLIENRGRDISALLVGCKDIILNYDYVCFAHDKKTKQVEPYVKGESFSYKCFENVLRNKHFVNNVINAFETNPRLGILSPPPPNHADFYPTIGLEWGINFHNTMELAKRLELKVPMDYAKEPIAPLGTMFWFRAQALKTLIEYDWEYKDFPKEPNNTDGTLLHAIERIYPFVAQHEGYYPAWLLADTFARIEITNLNYMLREINTQFFTNCGPTYHYSMVSIMKHNISYKVPAKARAKMFVKKVLPRPVFNLLKRIIKRR